MDENNYDLNTSRMILFGIKYDHVLTLIMVLAKFHIYHESKDIFEKRPRFDTFKREHNIKHLVILTSINLCKNCISGCVVLKTYDTVLC